jgi:hypothetical protein
VKLDSICHTIDESMLLFKNRIASYKKESRSELKGNLDAFKLELTEALKDYRERLRELFGEFDKNQKTQSLSSNEKSGEIKTTIENRQKPCRKAMSRNWRKCAERLTKNLKKP